MRSKRMVMAIMLVLVMSPMAPAAQGQTYTVEGDLHTIEVPIERPLSGVFEAEEMAPVSRVPKEWQSMEVLMAVDAGTVVEKGAPLVTLVTDDLDEHIAKMTDDLVRAKVAMDKAREELRLLEKSTQSDLAWERRVNRVAHEDFDHYMERDFPYREEELRLNKWSTELWRESVLLEYDELKRMYEADDLIETTEKLVLSQQELRLAHSNLANERYEKFDYAWQQEALWPRTMEQKRRDLLEADNKLERAETLKPIELQLKRLEVSRMTSDLDENRRKLDDLRADRATMIIRAPQAGMVYYGECVRGRWVSAADVANRLRPGGKLNAREVFMTVVDPSALFVRADAEEKDLSGLRKGLDSKVVPTGYPSLTLEGAVRDVRIIPCGPGPYTVFVELNDTNEAILPGMTCRATLTVHQTKEAVAVPAAAVSADDGETYVLLCKQIDEKTGRVIEMVRQAVEVGCRKDDTVEITKGLSQGDVIWIAPAAE